MFAAADILLQLAGLNAQYDHEADVRTIKTADVVLFPAKDVSSRSP